MALKKKRKINTNKILVGKS